MGKRRFGLSLALGASILAVGLATSSCGTPAAQHASAPAPVLLGALLPMSGRSAPSGTAMAAAARLAVKEANESGGVLGRKVELVVADDACDAGTAVVAADELVRKRIIVSVGGYCSSATVPTLSTFRAAGVPMIIPASNSTDLLVPQYDSVFLLSGTTVAEAAFAVDRIGRMGAHRLAVVDDGTSYSATLAASTAQAVGAPTVGAMSSARGPLALATKLHLSQGAPDYKLVAAAVRDADADVVYYTGYYAEANRLIADLRAAHFTGQIVVADGCIDPALFKGLTLAQTEGVYGTSLPVPEFQAGALRWSESYLAYAGAKPGANTMEAYDAVRLAVDAIRRAGSLDPAAVRAAIAGTANLKLVSGPIRFNPDGTRVAPEFLLLRAHGGTFVRA